MKRTVLIIVLFVLLVLIIASLAYTFDVDTKIQTLSRETARIDQAIAQRQKELNQLTQRRLTNIGAIAVLEEIKAEEKKVEAEEKPEVEEEK